MPWPNIQGLASGKGPALQTPLSFIHRTFQLRIQISTLRRTPPGAPDDWLRWKRQGFLAMAGCDGFLGFLASIGCDGFLGFFSATGSNGNLRAGALWYDQTRQFSSVQFSSVHLLSHVWLCDPVDCSMPGLPVRHQLPELALAHVH